MEELEVFQHNLAFIAQRVAGTFSNQNGNKDQLRACRYAVLEGETQRCLHVAGGGQRESRAGLRPCRPRVSSFPCSPRPGLPA